MMSDDGFRFRLKAGRGFAQCEKCGVYWLFRPPRWLGPPWTVEQIDALLVRHNDLVHGNERTAGDHE